MMMKKYTFIKTCGVTGRKTMAAMKQLYPDKTICF